jgi:hypothetical protein
MTRTGPLSPRVVIPGVDNQAGREASAVKVIVALPFTAATERQHSVESSSAHRRNMLFAKRTQSGQIRPGGTKTSQNRAKTNALKKNQTTDRELIGGST